MKIWLTILFVAVATLFAVLFAGPFFPLSPSGSAIHVGASRAADLVKYLESEEAAIHDIKPGLEKSILWADPVTQAQTEYAFVYFHGFSASRAEISPVMEDVAASLHANLYFTRLTAHGLKDGEAFQKLVAQDFIDDAREALAIGRRLGRKVILVGTSTGAPIAIHLAFENIHERDLAGLVMLSPNFGLSDWRGKFISGPIGPWLARHLIGVERVFKADNPAHAKFWTDRYRSEGIAAMMDLVNYVNTLDLSRLQLPVLVLYTHNDKVVNVDMIRTKFAEIGSPQKRLVDLPKATNHVLAGAALSPQAVAGAVDEITAFVRQVQESK